MRIILLEKSDVRDGLPSDGIFVWDLFLVELIPVFVYKALIRIYGDNIDTSEEGNSG